MVEVYGQQRAHSWRYQKRIIILSSGVIINSFPPLIVFPSLPSLFSSSTFLLLLISALVTDPRTFFCVFTFFVWREMLELLHNRWKSCTFYERRTWKRRISSWLHKNSKVRLKSHIFSLSRQNTRRIDKKGCNKKEQRTVRHTNIKNFELFLWKEENEKKMRSEGFKLSFEEWRWVEEMRDKRGINWKEKLWQDVNLIKECLHQQQTVSPLWSSYSSFFDVLFHPYHYPYKYAYTRIFVTFYYVNLWEEL